MVVGDEEDDEFGGGLELFLIVFCVEGVDVVVDFLCVFGEVEGVGGFVGGVECVVVGLYGCFGIDDDVLIFWEVDDEVGVEGVGGFLFGEICVGEYVGEFDDVVELEFVLIVGVVCGVEGGGEFGCFGLEVELGGVKGFELLVELVVCVGVGLFEFVDFCIYFFE